MKYALRMALITTALLALFTGVASAQSGDAELKKDIDRLLELTGSRAMSTQMASLVSTQLVDSLKRTQPNVPERAITVLKDVLDTELAKMFTAPDGIQQGMIELYAKSFTRDDINELIAFYSSPVGRKAVAMMPQLAQEGAALGKKWTEANMTRIMGVAQERLRSEGLIK
jgi:uncharacterized protein